jgi:hypothetical protein
MSHNSLAGLFFAREGNLRSIGGGHEYHSLHWADIFGSIQINGMSAFFQSNVT